MRRIVFVICLMIGGAVCGARQEATPVSARQAGVLPDPISSPEMDVLAGKLLEKLSEDKVTSLIVVGGGSREGKVSELALDLRDGLNDALVRQSTGIHVATRSETAAELKRLRVSIGMLYTDTLAGWIATNAHADGLVTIELQSVENGCATLTAEIFDKHTKIIYDKKTNAEVSSEKFESQVSLAEAQLKSATRDYLAPLNTSAGLAGKDGGTMPKCVSCPRPEYTEVGRKAKFKGTMYVVLTVLPDGTADDILVTRPVGYGLDGAAIDALLGWRFSPGLDKQDHPAAFQLQVQIRLELN